MGFQHRKPSIAVLLAAYNGLEWICDQINSILDQENVNVSVFVSVDASTDGTENIVASIAELDSRVRLLPYGMRFGGAGPNFYRLISDCDFSRFDAVALSDQDDIWFKTKLSKSWRIMQENSASVVSSNVIAFWPGGKRKFIKKSYKQREMDYFFEAAGPGCTYVFDCSTMIAFKQFLQCNSAALNGVDLHDWLAYAFCRHNGYRWVIDSEPSMLYRQHSNNQVGTNTNLKAYLKRLELIKSHWYRKQVNLIATLVAPDIDQRVTSLGFMLRNFNQLRRKPSERFILIVMRILGLF
ncbi:glycosyl transferase [Marinobacter sp. Z-F4-2]|nr:glycosyl transferase [Marinobacter sp. Z-F4-2]